MYFFLLNTDDRFPSDARFRRIRRLFIRLLNIALAGFLVFTLVSAALLALQTF